MFWGITDKLEISNLQNRLKAILTPFITSSNQLKMGHMGSSWTQTIHYSKKLDIWWVLDLSSNKKRYWNAFGIGDPTKKGTNIIVEINYPLEGVDFRVAANWAKDEYNNIFLFHSGKIGGGKKGIGQNTFLSNYSGGLHNIDLNGRIRECAMVGELSDKNFPYQLKNFIDKVAEIKGVISPSLQVKSHDFTKEFDGTKIYSLPQKVKASANHGIVVNTLFENLTASGHLVGSNGSSGRIDLFIYNKKNIITQVFEVKTNLSIQSVCTAIGQLFLYSYPLKNNPQMIFVCPEKVSPKVKELLESINIKVLLYKFKKDKPVFTNIENFTF